MKQYIEKLPFFLIVIFSFIFNNLYSQEAPIINYTTNNNNQVQLTVNSTPDDYFILKVRHKTTDEFELLSSMTLGENDSTIITESLEYYSLEHYQVLKYSKSNPTDTDGDGVNDIIEYNDIPNQAPLNAATPIDIEDGRTAINSLTTFKQISITKEQVQFAEYLNDKDFVKYIILDFNTNEPKTYFINSGTHPFHQDFTDEIGVDISSTDIQKGEIIYHPTTLSNNGTLGAFTFNYSNGHGRDFDIIQRTNELLAHNMPVLKNNLSYLVTANSQANYNENEALFEASRVSVIFETDLYAEIDYWGLNQSEGFGFFKLGDLEETPNARDIVLYESLPNKLPRVGGIITSVIQSPLSHVNLRAIQDNIPNSFIRTPLEIDSIVDLLDQYIYYKVEQDKYHIRAATLDEVNQWYESIRPTEAQNPPLNLSYTEILPLTEIGFTMSDGFGAKCANIATMHTFGFPKGTIPEGFGVPFYFYQEFMKHNGFFEKAAEMINDPDFKNDSEIREDKLKDFRNDIKDADMPSWMLDQLDDMHKSFPEGTSVRCRSSTNNEDLPGFNGAGLYDSKTQHPDEGHISKSIKQVFASLWNFRAYEDRAFYKVDHLQAAMGVLCHSNFSDEKVNGVGISFDPIYQTENTFYLNSQVGEDLITNPNGNSLPEEVLLDRYPITDDDYIILRRSSLIPSDSLVLGENYLNQMRTYLSVIHDRFAVLYNAVHNESFAVDIEYKVTKNDQLVIKQARPWVNYDATGDIIPPDKDGLRLSYFPNPTRDYINIYCDNCNINALRITNLQGQIILENKYNQTNNSRIEMNLQTLPKGVYILSGFNENHKMTFSRKLIRL